jgi:hypothetical protein
MSSIVIQSSSWFRQSLLALGCALVVAVPLGAVYGEHSSTDEGHASGHSGGESGGHSGGKSSGHGSGKGPRHKGHSSGAHVKGDAPNTTSEQFGGGHGLSGHHSVPEGIGRYGSDRSTSDDFGRVRFWGGWSNPLDDGPPPGDLVDAEPIVPGAGGGESISARVALDAAQRCDDVISGVALRNQYVQPNITRLYGAYQFIDPKAPRILRIRESLLMGNVQLELSRPIENPELLGIYFALVSPSELSADTVQAIGDELCTPLTIKYANEIVRIANEQRQSLQDPVSFSN